MPQAAAATPWTGADHEILHRGGDPHEIAPRPGGCFAFTIRADDEGWAYTSNRGFSEAQPGSDGESGNALRAVLECLGVAVERGAERVHLNLESGTIAGAIQRRLYREWRREGWRDEDGQPVAFPELWDAIGREVEALDYEVTANGKVAAERADVGKDGVSYSFTVAADDQELHIEESVRGLKMTHRGSRGAHGNRLRAVIECLRLAAKGGANRVHLRIDNGVVAEAIQARTYRKWRRTGWTYKSGKPVAFRELWKDIDRRIEAIGGHVSSTTTKSEAKWEERGQGDPRQVGIQAIPGR